MKMQDIIQVFTKEEEMEILSCSEFFTFVGIRKNPFYYKGKFAIVKSDIDLRTIRKLSNVLDLRNNQ